MPLPYPNDPSLPAAVVQFFGDDAFVRAEEAKQNNKQIWENFNYLDFPRMRFEVFDFSGTWICPPGVTTAVYVIIGAGGGGGGGGSGGTAGNDNNGGSGGGGSGGNSKFGIVTVSPGTSYPIVVGFGTAGAGGVQPNGTGGTGGAGGASTAFGVTANGGIGGSGGQGGQNNPGGAGAAAPTPDTEGGTGGAGATGGQSNNLPTNQTRNGGGVLMVYPDWGLPLFYRG
jgi:hypothetical protein